MYLYTVTFNFFFNGTKGILYNLILLNLIYVLIYIYINVTWQTPLSETYLHMSHLYN